PSPTRRCARFVGLPVRAIPPSLHPVPGSRRSSAIAFPATHIPSLPTLARSPAGAPSRSPGTTLPCSRRSRCIHSGRAHHTHEGRAAGIHDNRAATTGSGSRRNPQPVRLLGPSAIYAAVVHHRPGQDAAAAGIFARSPAVPPVNLGLRPDRCIPRIIKSPPAIKSLSALVMLGLLVFHGTDGSSCRVVLAVFSGDGHHGLLQMHPCAAMWLCPAS
ncbi:uncharacterized protein, partial [Miscanthus floridulus]|uniref:uncharacterized protein n=1 Tax=Miscanthus floridulus TaxID=154761 RepID=UPI00345A31FD